LLTVVNSYLLKLSTLVK